MHRERFPDRTPGRQNSTELVSGQRLGPGKRTLTEGLAVQRREARTDAGAGSESVASAPAPLPAQACSGPRPTLQMLFGVQRAAAAAPAENPAQVHAAAARGTAMSATRLPYVDQIQRAFGQHDISAIQAHVGPDAAASAREIGARAYATGDHVVLGEGADLHTVAHEAAHVVQQRGGVQLKGGVGEVGDGYERQADEVADRVVQGESAEGLLGAVALPRATGGAALQRKITVDSTTYDTSDEWNEDAPQMAEELLKEVDETLKDDSKRQLHPFYKGDFSAIAGKIKSWIAESEDMGTYDDVSALINFAAAQAGVMRLTDPDDITLLTDPEQQNALLGHQQQEADRRDRTGLDGKEHDLASPGYWEMKKQSSLDKRDPDFQGGGTVIGGHGYRKPWETDKVTIPEGTTLYFYVLDGEALPEHDAVHLALFGPSSKAIGDDLKRFATEHESQETDPDVIREHFHLVYRPDEQVENYTIVPPQLKDCMTGSPVTFNTRRKLSEIVAPNLGEVHMAICREVDWWGSFSKEPGNVHDKPDDWKYVVKRDYKGYLGPHGEQGPTL